jgi:hypothetical protein
MGASKIVDEGEIVRWYEEGRTYRWMCDEYRSKYSIDTVQSMFGNFRKRRGLERRITRDDDLIPWHVMKDHRWAYPWRCCEWKRDAGRDGSFDRRTLTASPRG